MVPYQDSFAPPTEGSVFVSSLELLIGELFKLIHIHIVDKLRFELLQYRNSGSIVVGADVLTDIAAPNQLMLFHYFYIICRKVSLFLCYVGFAALRVYCEVTHDALAWTFSDTFHALETGPVLRGVRLEGVIVQNVSNKNVRSVLIRDQVTVDPPEAKAGFIRQVPVAERTVVDEDLILKPIEPVFQEFSYIDKLIFDDQVIIDTVGGFRQIGIVAVTGEIGEKAYYYRF